MSPIDGLLASGHPQLVALGEVAVAEEALVTEHIEVWYKIDGVNKANI